MHLLREQEEKLTLQMKVAQIDEEREGAESKRLELEQALEEFVRSTDKKGKLAVVEKKASLEQGLSVITVFMIDILLCARFQMSFCQHKNSKWSNSSSLNYELLFVIMSVQTRQGGGEGQA